MCYEMNRLFIEKHNAKDSKDFVLEKGYKCYSKTCSYNGSFTDFTTKANLLVSKDGKPYFAGIDLPFSLSHSGDYIVCLFSSYVCGVDIQEKREASYIEIAERFYLRHEIDYVKENGLDGFYDIWTRREAYGKMTGIGFFCDHPSFVDENLNLRSKVKYKEDLFYLLSPSKDHFRALENYSISICSRERGIIIEE